MGTPTIEELKNDTEYALIAELNHKEIKEFVINQLANDGKIVRLFMIYQVIMIIVGIFFFSRSVILAFGQNFQSLLFSTGAVVISFSVLIPVHEILHGVALKLTGAKKVTYGGYFKKFIFYAEADRHVLNKKKFALVALTPLLTVKLITLIGIIVFMNHPVFYSLIIIMSAHSLFCAGDIGLLSIFYQNKTDEIYTFDVKAEKKSYYYKKVTAK